MEVISGNLDLWVKALRGTLDLFAGGGLLALVLGTLVCVMRVSPVPIVRIIGTVYVTLVRNTPLTLLFFFFIFGYPQLDLPKLGAMPLSIFAIGVYTAVYVAEVLRAGINTLPAGQIEAARALGFSFAQVIRLIVLPQAFRSVLPPMMSVFIALVKNTTVAAGFSVLELGAVRAYLSERGENALVVLLWVCLIFVIFSLLLGGLQRYLEKRWRIVR